MKRIAIVGAGFAGLATAWHLLSKKSVRITLFDAVGVGGGASGIAAGLMHPYAGAHAKRSKEATQGIASTKILLDISSQQLDQSIYKEEGMLRLALSPKQQQDFLQCADQHDDVKWLTPNECESILLQPCPFPGLFIQSAMVVNCPRYLNGLFLACQTLGMKFVTRQINSLSELNEYDKVVVTTGAMLLPELSSIPIYPIKGQILKLSWPENLPKPLLPISTKAYLIPDQELLGATFEHHFTSISPDLEFTKQKLFPQIHAMYPTLKEAVDCRSALRASTPNRQPLIKQIDRKCWVYAGLASKGLLYHSLFAEKLVEAMTPSL